MKIGDNELEIHGENDPQTSSAGTTIKNANSKKGKIKVADSTGHGIKAEKLKANDDIVITSTHGSPKNTVPSDGLVLGAIGGINANGLVAHGDITINQFLNDNTPLVEQLNYFLKQVGIDKPKETQFAKDQYQAYCSVWKNLLEVKLAGDSLWEEVNSKTLGDFADKLRKTEKMVEQGGIYFEENDRQALLAVLHVFMNFDSGKARLLDLEKQDPMLNDKWIQGEFQKQIDANGKTKAEYGQILERIRISFRDKLSRI